MLQRLKRAQRYLVVRKFLNLLVAGLAVLTVAFGFARLGARVGLALPGWVSGWVTWLVAASVLALTSAFVAWRRAPTLLAVARLADHRLGLAERLSTSLEVEGRTDALALRLRADAEAHAERVRPAALVSPGPTRTAVVWLAGAALFGAGKFVLPLGVPADRVAAAEVAGQEGAVTGAPTANAFIRDLLTEAAPRPVTTPVERRNALSDEQLQELSVRGPSEATARPAGQVSAAGVPVAPLSVAEQQALDPEARLVDRPAATDPVTAAADAAPGASAARAGDPNAPLSVVDPRNDGTTNPNYNQAAARDQELREYARRREAGQGPGGGDGDQVAMADAAVAGSATAGFEDAAAEGAPMPAPAAQSELSLSDMTDSSGRRVALERLPDEIDAVPADWRPQVAAWAPLTEPPVSHDLMLASETELLQRYYGATP